MTAKTKIILSLAIIAILLGGFFYWQSLQTKKLLQAPAANVKPSPAAGASQSLGAQVYEQSQNPVKDQVPENNAFKNSSANPVSQSYKNPFQ